MPFLPPNQQRQSTEGEKNIPDKYTSRQNKHKAKASLDLMDNLQSGNSGFIRATLEPTLAMPIKHSVTSHESGKHYQNIMQVKLFAHQQVLCSAFYISCQHDTDHICC